LLRPPLWFNATFALLGKRFEYPDILRRPTSEVRERFRAGSSGPILLWWAFMLTGLLLIGGAVLLGQSLGFGGIVPLATAIGVLAGLVQMLGLLRWVDLRPERVRRPPDWLDRTRTRPSGPSSARCTPPCSARCTSTSESESVNISAISSLVSGRS
jgi:Domain of unknown function (DUF4386)